MVRYCDLDEAYDNLSNAIVLQAVKDYTQAVYNNDTRMMVDCETFFRSDWCNALSCIDCAGLAENLREKVQMFTLKATEAFDSGFISKSDKPEDGAFRCPICGGNVFVKSKVLGYFRSKRMSEYGLQAKCSSCDFAAKRVLGRRYRNDASTRP